MIYLDNNSTTRVSDAVFESMVPFLKESYFNPSSIHQGGEKVRASLESAREQLAATMGVRPAELTWTSGGTESINWAIRGVVEAGRGRRRVVTSAVEHPATLDICDRLEKSGCQVVRLPVEADGTLPPERVKEALDDDTALLTLLSVNNETGVRLDIEAIGALARERDVPFHVDAVQDAGKGIRAVMGLPIDLLSFSGHKFGAPKGVGGLWIRRGTRIQPLVWGGHHEKGRRGGTENVAGAVAMATALVESEQRWAESAEMVGELRGRLEKGVLDAIPDVLVCGDAAARIENTTCLCFPHIEGAAVVLTLSAAGVHCSSGSACSAAQEGPSHVLQAMGVPGGHVHGAVRFSLSTWTTQEEVEKAIAATLSAVRHVARVNTH